MKQEDKQLLLIDICARLPYGVETSNGNGILKLSPRTDVIYIVDNEHIPYLRPMSSMTEEESAEFEELFPSYSIARNSVYHSSRGDLELEFIDWLNAHHFDYRGLIEKGLALEAPERMYK